MDLIALIAKVAPGWAARYEQNRDRYEVARLYDAASPSHLRPTRGDMRSGNAVLDATQDKLRQLARHLDENHDLAVGVLDDLLANTIGDGRVPIPMVRLNTGELATDTNQRLLDQWHTWAEKPDVTLGYGMAELERLVARTWLRDGEVFLKLIRSSRFGYHSETRLAIEALEPDFCPFWMVDKPRGIIHGVERNAWGQPSAYHFLDDHPGDLHLSRGRILGATRRHLAANVIHLRFVRRLHQVRGVSVLHAALNRLRDVADYEESERIAARMAAELTGYIKRTGEFNGKIDDSKRVLQMQSGAFFELLPGEDVGTISSDRPNTGLGEFRASMLRAVAAGTGTRYSAIARNFEGTYSSQRQELVEAAVNYRALFRILVNRVHIPLWRAFLQATPTRLERGVDLSTFERVDFRPPALPWIDPEKEAKAWALLIESGLESRAEIMRMRGRDPDKVGEEIERERATAPQPAAGSEEAEGDDNDEDAA